MPTLHNNGASCTDGIKSYSFNCTAGFPRLYCETGEKKINETQYCDHTLNIHVSSFRETHITAIDHRFLMRKKYHGQRKDGLKCHTNSRRKYNMNHQLITSPLGVFVLDIDDCVNHTCTNGASCIDGISGFSCNCSVGFSGKHCETSKYSAKESRIASSR